MFETILEQNGKKIPQLSHGCKILSTHWKWPYTQKQMGVNLKRFQEKNLIYVQN
jgi:hypothetical protein